MKHNFYDAVFLGGEFHSLMAAALLSRWGFRVLVIGQGTTPLTYPVSYREQPLLLPTGPDRIWCTRSRIFQAFSHELNLSFEHLPSSSQTTASSLQILLPEQRLSIPTSSTQLLQTLQTAFPDVQFAAEQLIGTLERLNPSYQNLLDPSLHWPPTNWFQHRRIRKKILPLVDNEYETDVLSDFFRFHPMRTAIHLPAIFESDLAFSQLSSLAINRHLDHGFHPSVANANTTQLSLQEKLIEHIRVAGGDFFPDESVTAVHTERQKVTGVVLNNLDQEIGTNFLVLSDSPHHFKEVLPHESKSTNPELYHPPKTEFFRYTANAVFDFKELTAHPLTDFAPVDGTSLKSFFITHPPSQSLTHTQTPFTLKTTHCTHVEIRHDLQNPDLLVCTCQTTIPAEDIHHPESFSHAQNKIRNALRQIDPALGPLTQQLFSPHKSTQRNRTPRAHNEELPMLSSTVSQNPDAPEIHNPKHAYSMRPICSYPSLDLYDLGMSTPSLPFNGILHFGRHILPALGLEGALLSGWKTAKAISQSDKNKEMIRRSSWIHLKI